MKNIINFWIFTFVILHFLGSTAAASELNGVLKNNAGVKYFSTGHSIEAYDRFTNALTDIPFSPEVHFNIATTFLEHKEYEKAVSEYTQALKLNAGSGRRAEELRFYTNFNLASALTVLKKNEAALWAYQKALEAKPDSVEAKTNIEYLTQSGQGDGEGDKDQEQKNKDEKNKDDKDKKDQKPSEKPKPNDLNTPPKEKKPKPQPKPFKSDELTNQDVNQILDELKRQEENVRAKMNREGAKDAPAEKDW
jgi:Ca-activated chloride channel family protein